MASIEDLNKIDQFPQGKNTFDRIVRQVFLLMKLFWQEKRGNLGMSIAELLFPIYPLIFFYILIKLEVFPYERFEFPAVDFYDEESFDTSGLLTASFLNDPSSLGFGPDNDAIAMNLANDVCDRLGINFGNTTKFSTESDIFAARGTNLQYALFFDVMNPTANEVDFTVFFISIDVLKVPLNAIKGIGFDERQLSRSEVFFYSGIIALQKAANEAILALNNITVDMNLSFQKLPDDAGVDTANFLEFMFPFLFLGALFFCLRGMMMGVGDQCEKGIREAMELKGMDRRAMWIAMVINYTLSTALTVTILVPLLFATFYKHTSFGFIYADFFLLGCAQTAFGVMVLGFAGDKITGQRIFVVSIIFFILMQVIFMVYMFAVVPYDVSDTTVRLIYLAYLVPFAQILSISTEGELLGKNLSTALNPNVFWAFYMLIIDTLLYLFIAFTADYIRQLYKRKSFYVDVEAEGKAAEMMKGESRRGIHIYNLVKEFKIPLPKKPSGGYDEKLKPNERLYTSFTDSIPFFPRYKILRAIDGLTLEVKENEIFCLLGHNGAGKTTTFNCLIGSTSVTSGAAYINNMNVVQDREFLRKRLGVCPQQDIVMQHVKAIDQLKFQAQLYGKSLKEAETEAMSLLSALELTQKANEYPNKMSGGQKRRLTLALALIGKPSVIVLDEPTTGLDPNNRRRIWKLLQELKKEHTILMTTHSLEEADALADTIAIMADGKLQVMGSPLQLKKQYGSGYKLTCLKSSISQFDDDKAENLRKLIEKYVPDTAILSNAGAEISFSLQDKHMDTYPKLFDFLEGGGAREAGIDSFGLSPTTLEDVFLNLEVKRDEEDDSDDKSLKSGKSKTSRSNGGKAFNKLSTVEKKELINRLEGKPQNPIFRRQLYSIFVQVATTMIRSPLTYIFLILYPIIFTIVFSEVFDLLQPGIPKPQTISISAQFNSSGFAATSIPISVNSTSQEAEVEAVLLPEFLNEVFYSTEDLYEFLTVNKDNGTFIGGYDFSDIQITPSLYQFDLNIVIEQDKGFSLPVLLQEFYSGIASASNSSNLIPSGVIYQSFPDVAQQNAIVGGGGIAYILAIALSIQASHFCVEMMNLRVKGVKQMLLLSGLPKHVFWLSNLLAHSCVVLIPSFAVYIVMLLYKSGGSNDSSPLAFILLFIAFAFPCVLFGYNLSFLFSDEEAAGQFGAESANLVLLIPWLLVSFVFTEQYLWFENLMTIFAPGFGIYRGLSLLATNSENKRPIDTRQVFIWEDQFIQILFFLFLSTLFYGTVLFSVDTNLVGQLKAYRNNKLIMKKKLEEVEDKDETEAAAKLNLENLEHVRLGILPNPVSAIPMDVPIDELRIKCEHINKRFVLNDGSVFQAVKDASLGVKRNQIFGLLGPNGAGKTTLIKCITGLDSQIMDDGFASIFGHDVLSERTKVLPLMGICPQFDALLDSLTGRELLRLFARIRGVAPEDVEVSVESYLDLLNLTPKADDFCVRYSGGNKRRLSVALSMIGSPRAIFLDEPSTGLDPSTRRRLWKFLQEKAQANENEENVSNNRALLLTTHSMEEADALCGNIAIMVSSSIRTVGTSQELKTRYGAGTVVILGVDSQSDLVGIEAMIKELHTDSLCLDKSLSNIKYFLPQKGTSWSEIFATLLKNHETLHFSDFAVSQRSLEDVFIEFANLQPNEDD